MGSLTQTTMLVQDRHFFAASFRHWQLVPNSKYATARPTSELIYTPSVRRPCDVRGEQAEPVLIQSEGLSLLCLVR